MSRRSKDDHFDAAPSKNGPAFSRGRQSTNIRDLRDPSLLQTLGQDIRSELAPGGIPPVTDEQKATYEAAMGQPYSDFQNNVDRVAQYSPHFSEYAAGPPAIQQFASAAPQTASAEPAETSSSGGGGYKITRDNVRQASPIIQDIVQHAADAFVAANPGYRVEAFSGKEGRAKNAQGHSTQNHPRGNAIDVQIIDPSGRILPSSPARAAKAGVPFAPSFRQYEQLAQMGKAYQKEAYPKSAFRWGGYFSQGVTFDAMHMDITSNQMALGTWEGGLTPAGRKMLPGAQSVGMAEQPGLLKRAGTAVANAAETAGRLLTGVGPYTPPTPQPRPPIEQGNVISSVFDGPEMAFAGPTGQPTAVDAISNVFGSDVQPVAQIGNNRFFAPKGTPVSAGDIINKHTPPEVIQSLQTSLANAGINPGKIDGKLGPQTQAAIKAFQQVNGLQPDGIAGPDTLNAIAQGAGGAPIPQARPELQGVRPGAPDMGGGPSAPIPQARPPQAPQPRPDVGMPLGPGDAVAGAPAGAAQESPYPADTPQSLGWDSRFQAPTMQQAWQSDATAGAPPPTPNVNGPYPADTPQSLGWDSRFQAPTMQGAWQSGAQAGATPPTPNVDGSAPNMAGGPGDLPVSNQNDFTTAPGFKPEVPGQGGFTMKQVFDALNGISGISSASAAVPSRQEMTDGQGISVPPNDSNGPLSSAFAPQDLLSATPQERMPPNMGGDPYAQMEADRAAARSAAGTVTATPTPVPTTSFPTPFAAQNPTSMYRLQSGEPYTSFSGAPPDMGATPPPQTPDARMPRPRPDYTPPGVAPGDLAQMGAPPMGAAPAPTSWGDTLTNTLGNVGTVVKKDVLQPIGSAVNTAGAAVRQGATDLTKHITESVKEKIGSDPIEHAFKMAHNVDGSFDNKAFWGALDNEPSMTQTRQAQAARMAAQGNLANKTIGGAIGGSLVNGPPVMSGWNSGGGNYPSPGSGDYNRARDLTNSTGGAF